MAEETHAEATRLIEAHGRAIDALHQALAKLHAAGDAAHARLAGAIDRYKKAHRTFHDDVLGDIGTQQ